MTDTSTLAQAAHSLATVHTPHAARYLSQLCKHFEHKTAVSLDGDTGVIAFIGMGICDLAAGSEGLALSLTSPDPVQLGKLQDVVGRHLLRFAFREDMAITWRAA
jgi:hypothetical protein